MISDKQIGLYFGSFNPVHVGHLIIAQNMVDNTDIDEVWFVLTPQNPHKKKKSLLADHHRLALLRIATEDNSSFRVSDVEFNLPQPSYTIHSLEFLNEKYRNHNFAIIMGGDNLKTFHKWKNYKQILKHYKIYVYPRNTEYEKPNFDYGEIEIVKSPLIEISASLIRQNIKEGKSVRYLLPEKVFNYVDEMFFYK